MRTRLIFWIPIFLFIAASFSRAAATIEIMPLVGYRLNGSRELAGPTNNRLDLMDKPIVGGSVGYLTKDQGEIELAWTHSNTQAEVERAGGLPTDRFDVKVDQFHINFMAMTDPEPWQPFVLVGLGATRFSPSVNRSSTTRFSFALGGGAKWILNDYVGLRFDARWTPVLAQRGTHFFCDDSGTGECYSTENNSYVSKTLPFLNNFEFTTGLLFRY
jgi:opacity protein-like surface antigen